MKLQTQHINLYRTILARGLSKGCSDIDSDEVTFLTTDEWKEFCVAYYTWSRDTEILKEKGFSWMLQDWMVVDYITNALVEYYLKNEINRKVR